LPSRYPRLSLADRMFLRVESPGGMDHIAGLCVLQEGPLLDADGQLDVAMIKRRLERRLARVPELRRIIHRPPPFGGPTLWVDDPRFSIDRHVRTAAIAAPGNEGSLLDAAIGVAGPLLDHSRPLWELWFLTGLAGDRLGMVFKIHHAIADGLAAIALVISLFDLEADAPDPAAVGWSPGPTPRRLELVADNLRCRLAALGSAIAHPAPLWRGLTSLVAESRRLSRLRAAAPRSSVNARVGTKRCGRVISLDLESSRAAAHQRGAKVNDVVLSIAAGGLRDLLIARGEKVDAVELVAGVPATLRGAQTARDLGNSAGGLMVRLPVGEAHTGRRLELIAASSRIAKSEQRASSIQALMDWLGAAGLAQRYVATQRMVNVMATNVPGPPVPLYFLGSKIEDIIPIIGTAGNVTIVFVALSYNGRLNVAVIADADANPDIHALIGGMQRSSDELGVRACPQVAHV
jgi:diacylglycerol O-acyltransferase / wax synthase